MPHEALHIVRHVRLVIISSLFHINLESGGLLFLKRSPVFDTKFYLYLNT